jgi:hypothetical protein
MIRGILRHGFARGRYDQTKPRHNDVENNREQRHTWIAMSRAAGKVKLSRDCLESKTGGGSKDRL